MTSSTIPAFLTKLLLMIENEENNKYIYWGKNGESFHIRDSARFAKDILPLYFKHNNLASFIRQLNMYGFRKLNSYSNNALNSSSEMEFAHKHFIRGKFSLMNNIHRKPNNSHGSSVLHEQTLSSLNNHVPTIDDYNYLTTVVNRLKQKQDLTFSQMYRLKAENEAFYQELVTLRRNHDKQSKMIHSLFSFLSAIAQDPNQGFCIPNFRKSQLSIEGGSSSQNFLIDFDEYLKQNDTAEDLTTPTFNENSPINTTQNLLTRPMSLSDLNSISSLSNTIVTNRPFLSIKAPPAKDLQTSPTVISANSVKLPIKGSSNLIQKPRLIIPSVNNNNTTSNLNTKTSSIPSKVPLIKPKIINAYSNKIPLPIASSSATHKSYPVRFIKSDQNLSQRQITSLPANLQLKNATPPEEDLHMEDMLKNPDSNLMMDEIENLENLDNLFIADNLDEEALNQLLLSPSTGSFNNMNPENDVEEVINNPDLNPASSQQSSSTEAMDQFGSMSPNRVNALPWENSPSLFLENNIPEKPVPFISINDPKKLKRLSESEYEVGIFTEADSPISEIECPGKRPRKLSLSSGKTLP